MKMSWEMVLEELNNTSPQSATFISRVQSDEDLAPSMVALANGRGGRLIIGLDTRNCHLTGTTVDSDWIYEVLKCVCYPQIKVEIDLVFRNNKHLVILDVYEGQQKPYSYKNKIIVYKDNSLQEASDDEVEKLQAVSSFKQQKRPEPPMHIQHASLLYPPSFNVAERKQFVKPGLSVDEDDAAMLSEESIAIQAELDRQDAEKTVVQATPRIKSAQVKDASEESVTPLTDRQKKTMLHMKKGTPELNRIRNKKYRKLFDVSHKTAHYELVDLVERGFLEQEGSGRSTCYKLTAAVLAELSVPA
jgi:predicted HTH transcriptional regulator